MKKNQKPPDETLGRPSRSAKSHAMSSAVWRGAAPQGRKRLSSTSPSRDSQSAKRAKSQLSNSGRRASDTNTIVRQKTSRKRPVSIISDEDEDNGRYPTHRSKVVRQPRSVTGTRRKHHAQEDDDQSSSNSSSEDDSDDADEEGIDDGVDDLQALDGDALTSRLEFERARCSSKPRNKKALGNDVELTTASEVDGKPFEDEEQEEDKNSQADDDDNGVPRHRNYKVSTRERTRRAEVPKFLQSSKSQRARKNIEPDDSEGEESSSDDAADPSLDPHYHIVNKGWHVDAHYVPPQAGARIISIKAQPSTLQTVIKASIREVTSDALFVTAFPSAVSTVDYYRDILKEAAGNLDLDALSDRFKKDRKFAEVISRVLAARLSNLRCSLKKSAASEVKGFYGLIPGDACRDRVKKLVSSTEYIYARHEGSGLPFRTKPFRHLCIISTLKEWAFTSTRRASLAEKHIHRFESSISNGPQSAELELPIAMVCLVATAVHASLDDWAEGHHKKTEFNADLYEDVYKGHEDVLVSIRDKNPTGFHRLMADLYNDVSSKHAQQATSVANSAMALLDIDGMDT